MKKVFRRNLISIFVFLFTFLPVIGLPVQSVFAWTPEGAGYVGGGVAEDGTLDIAGEAQRQGLQGSEFADTQDGGAGVFIGNILRVVLLVAVIVSFFFILLGAFEWITSGGDKGKLESARNKITNAVIGLIVLSAATALIMLVQGFLGVKFLSFSF